ncbi:glycosyltransferase [Aquitalea denitrificans]|uniref:glycosyltransferase n=1 Tax=Aquitalea denitrificans TaxID=519081 RepID=UPI00135C2F15|nr:glycosyltransferase [Aquitalea denitrificans]
MTQAPRITAIYTTYNPDDGFRERIRHVVGFCASTIVVDNTPGGHVFAPGQTDDLILLQDGCNKGLGAALNAGIAEALRLGSDMVVLFDQDSSPPADFMPALYQGLLNAGSRAIIGPWLVDDAAVSSAHACSGAEPVLEEVTCIATSGMCFNLAGLTENDRFTEDFFLDFVDFDWCWRLRKQGWRICRLRSLPMPHRLGLAQHKFLGLTYHVPAPFRHYFQFRDTIKLCTRSYVPLYSRVRLSLILLPKLLVYPFLLDRGLERLNWMLRGIRDAMHSVPGIGAAAAKLQGRSPSNSSQ